VNFQETDTRELCVSGSTCLSR